MSRKPSFTVKEKVDACLRYMAGASSYALASELGCNQKTIIVWVHAYEKYGSQTFEEKG